jgi:hypothetical protein
MPSWRTPTATSRHAISGCTPRRQPITRMSLTATMWLLRSTTGGVRRRTRGMNGRGRGRHARRRGNSCGLRRRCGSSRMRPVGWQASALRKRGRLKRGYATRALRVRASDVTSLARIVRSAWSRTRSSPRTRSGSSAHSCLSRPNSRSTAPRERYSFAERSESRGISGCSLSALTHVDAGVHWSVGQRHWVALALVVGAGERPLAVLACRRPVVADIPCSRCGSARCRSPCP